VKPLDSPAQVRGILSFDFDGTLHLPQEEVVLDPRFYQKIEELRADGWLWAINTGRSLLYMLEGFKESDFRFAPDFLVAREREIYTPGDAFGRWHRIEEWHAQYARDTALFLDDAKEFIALVKEYVLSATAAQWVEEEGDPAGIVASSEEEAFEILNFVNEHRHLSDLIGVLHNTIYMRFTHNGYNKGSSLKELARCVGVPASAVFAIGDGHNDIDKLHPDVAGMIACVGNAHQEVIDYVDSHNGYVAKAHGSMGSVEALEYFLGK
jgi:HAD superfamily hydrolase (TIGR01484 family)